MTGLPNRNVLQDRLSQGRSLDARRENTPLTQRQMGLVTGFRGSVTRSGHHYGDLLLQRLGRVPQRSTRLGHRRTPGGDEFNILLPPQMQAVQLRSRSNCCLRMLEAPFEARRTVGRDRLRASVIASYPSHGSDGVTLLQRADVAMYVAKRGDSRIVVYTAERDHYSAERLARWRCGCDPGRRAPPAFPAPVGPARRVPCRRRGSRALATPLRRFPSRSSSSR